MSLLPANLILINGKIESMEDMAPEASAVAVIGDRIAYVGNDRDALSLQGNETIVIDLKGKSALPGFIESHAHPIIYAETLLGVDCGGPNTTSLKMLLKSLESKAAQTPKGTWIKGWGWDDSKFEERRVPSRWDLDAISTDHPVVLARQCGHTVVANSLALQLSGIGKDTQDPPEGGHVVKDPATGEPTGILQERAQELLLQVPISREDYKRGFLLAQQEFAKKGVTTIHDMTTQPLGIRIYQELLRDENLTVRIRMWPFAVTANQFEGMMDTLIQLGIESGFGSTMLNVQGSKFLLDGGIGGKTAAVSKPFEDDPDNMNNRGIMYYSKDEPLAELVTRSLLAGLRVSLHAIGDRAIEQALNVIEIAQKKTGKTGMRNRIEHCTIPNAGQIDRIKDLKIAVGASTGFIYSIGAAHYYNLGTERCNHVFPMKTFKEKRIVAAGNSDAPVCDLNPILGVYSIVTRNAMSGHNLGTDECLPVVDALRAYTINAAYLGFDEKLIGSLQAGKFADIVVLDRDPLTVDPLSLKDIQVVMTIMNGKIIYGD